MGFIVPDPQEIVFGEELNGKITNFLFTCAIAIGLFETIRNWLGCKREPGKYTLRMKKLKNITGEFLHSGSTWDNALNKEHNFIFLNMGDIIDYSVMKLVSDDVQILTDQEHQHAKLHHIAAKVDEQSNEPHIKWFRYCWDKMFLRLPRCLRASITLAVESMSPLMCWIGFVNPISKGQYNNLFAFHAFEEIEHAAVTCHRLKEECPFVLRVVGMMLFAFMGEATVLIGEYVKIPLAIYRRPELILRPKFWLVDIPVFYINFSLLTLFLIPYMMVHYVFAIPHFEWMNKKFLADAEAFVKERGFEWDIVSTEEFTLDKSLRKKKAPTYKYLEFGFYFSMAKPYLTAALDFALKQGAAVTQFLDKPVYEYFDCDKHALAKGVARLEACSGLRLVELSPKL